MLLLRPQRLKRAASAGSDQALLDDLLSLIGKIGVDKALGGTILETLEACAEPLGLRLVQRAGGGFDTAVHRLQNLLSPLSDRLHTLSPTIGGGAEAPQVAGFAVTLLSTIASAAGGLSIGALRDHVGTFLDVLQNDLGLTSAAIEAEIWSLIDDIVTRLQAIPAEADAAVRENRLAVIGVIQRIKLRLQGVVHFPDLNADRVAGALFDDLKGGGIAGALDKIACVGKGVGAGLTVATDLAKIVPFTGFGSHSLGAAQGGTSVTRDTTPAPDTASQYFWYGSWLLGDKNRTDWQKVFGTWIFLDLWRPKRDVWTGGSPEAVYFGDNLFLSGSDITWDQLPNPIDVAAGNMGRPFLRYTFKHVSASTMEDVARHTAWVADSLEALQHIFSMSGLTITKGGMVSITDLLELLELTALTGFEVGMKMPWKFFIGRKTGTVGGFALGKALPFLCFTFPGSFQGFHTNASAGESFLFWLLLLVSDVINLVSDGLIGGAVRDGLLSWLTIINYDPSVASSTSADDRPDNRSQIDGVVGLFTFLSTLLLVKVVVDRKDYGIEAGGAAAKLILEYGLLGGLISGAVGGLLGTVAAWAIGGIWGAGSGVVDAKVLGLTVLRTALSAAAPHSFLLSLYGLKENDTGGGTWNPTGASFNGYPDNSDSPYSLPWAAGTSIMCFQGNLGFFSHNFVNPTEQVYAYDLMLDKGTEILAARPGTVVDYFDWVPDGSHSSTNTTPSGPVLPVAGQTNGQTWNFIMIMHDQAGAPDPKHDLGPGGTKTTTYAIYGHGQQGTVRSSFLANGVQPANIIGTVVKQGQVIMHADNTGNSFCNHVHMEVRPGPGPVAPPAGGVRAPVQFGTIVNNGSIPFVFKEVSNQGIGGPGGVCKSRRFYQSNNTKVGN
jgi:murein DD-endopeptidase MepM/ murein hydrolase activator NlpD